MVPHLQGPKDVLEQEITVIMQNCQSLENALLMFSICIQEMLIIKRFIIIKIIHNHLTLRVPKTLVHC